MCISVAYNTKHSKEDITIALDKGQNTRITNNGWEKLVSSLSDPINLGDLKTPGNYSILFWTDGPNFGDKSITPINVTVVQVDGVITQLVNAGGKYFNRSIASGEINYGRWKIDSNNYDINPGPTSPGAPISGETLWLDTSDSTNPLLKLYINAEWKVIDPEGVMKSDIYDTQEKETDIFKYIDDVIAQSSVGEITELVNNHLKDTIIHTTAAEKSKWRSSATEEELAAKVNTFIEEMNTVVTTEVNSNSTEVDTLNTEITTEYDTLVKHMSNATIHPDQDKQAEWNNKADKDHTHILDGKVTISGEQIVGNLNDLDESKIPYTAKERIYTINSYDEMNALKLDPVHNGDIVVMNDGINKEYYEVTDESRFGTDSYKLAAKRIIMPSTQGWRAICYGNDKFVVVCGSNSKSNVFAYSSDGITWTQGTLPSEQYWECICYGKDKFVVTDTAVFAYSSDGITWIEGTLPARHSWDSLCYGNDKFVAIPPYDTEFAYSSDGITWTQGTLPVDKDWKSVCYGNDKFVVIAAYTNVFAYSSDGITWTQGTLPVDKDWNSVCYGKDKYVAVADGSDVFVYSSDGITWTQGTLPVDKDWYSVCYGNDKFVAVAYSTDIFVYSSDGITWTESNMPLSQKWAGISYGKDKFVALSYSTDIFACLLNITTAVTQIPNNTMYEWNKIIYTPTTAEGYYISDGATQEDYDNLINQMTEESLSSDPGTVDLSNTVFTDTNVAQIVSAMDTLKAKLSPLDTYISQVNSLIKIQ